MPEASSASPRAPESGPAAVSRVIEELPVRVQRRGSISVPLRLLAAVAVGAVLYFGHAAFVPVVLAVLFALLLTGPVEALHRHSVPRSAAAILILLIFVGALGGAVNLVWTPAQSWWASAPRTVRTIERKLRPAARFMGRIEMLTDHAGDFAQPPGVQGAGAGAGAAPAPARAAAGSAPIGKSDALTLLNVTRTALVGVATTIIVTLFLLAGGPPMLARMSATLASDLQSARMLKVINEVRSEVGRYYGCIALINIGLGLATAAVMTLLGMPSPLLWGAVAALFNFVPYVGSATTLLLLTIVAFVSFDSVARVLAVPGCYLALSTLEGQVVQPLVVGRRLELNPIIVFLSLWFGGWFWGIPGIVIAIPTLVSLKVVAEHSRGVKPLQAFLSPNDLSRYHPKQVGASLAKRRGRR